MPPVYLPFLIIAVLLGLVFGSFLNVCVVRLPRGESIVAPSSHCVYCQSHIRPYDNLPIVSWLWLRGRCRDCRARISIRYPLVEAASATLFIACLLKFGLGWCAAGMAIFCWLLLGLALMDAETYLLPNAFTLPGIAIGIVFHVVCSGELLHGLLQSMLGLTVISGILLLIRTAYQLVRRREGMGVGDIKLGAMLGAWLGWRLGLVELFLAIVGGAVAGLLVVLFQARKVAAERERAASLRIPFGTFLAGAGIITVFAGDPLLHWYLGLFP